MKPGKEAQVSLPASGSAIPDASTFLISIELSSDYHSLGRFINELENSDVLLAVLSLKMISQPLNYFKQRVNLVLVTYVKK